MTRRLAAVAVVGVLMLVRSGQFPVRDPAFLLLDLLDDAEPSVRLEAARSLRKLMETPQVRDAVIKKLELIGRDSNSIRMKSQLEFLLQHRTCRDLVRWPVGKNFFATGAIQTPDKGCFSRPIVSASAVIPSMVAELVWDRDRRLDLLPCHLDRTSPSLQEQPTGKRLFVRSSGRVTTSLRNIRGGL